MVSAYFFGVSGLDQRLHGRDPDPESRPCARRRRRALGRLRPGLQRPAREGRAGARVARRVDALLADAARARRRDRRLHPARAAAHEAVRRSGRRLRPRRRPLARPVPDRRPPRALGDRRRDPQHVPPLRAAGARARRVEPRDHPRSRPRHPADRRARARSSISTPASSCSARSSSSSCRSRGCDGSTGG